MVISTTSIYLFLHVPVRRICIIIHSGKLKNNSFTTGTVPNRTIISICFTVSLRAQRFCTRRRKHLNEPIKDPIDWQSKYVCEKRTERSSFFVIFNFCWEYQNVRLLLGHIKNPKDGNRSNPPQWQWPRN